MKFLVRYEMVAEIEAANVEDAADVWQDTCIEQFSKHNKGTLRTYYSELIDAQVADTEQDVTSKF